jgi:ATP-dependent DNA helicase RecG
MKEARRCRANNFLEKIGRERDIVFSTHDLMVLDLVRRELPVPSELRSELKALTDEAIIESIGRGRGVRYFLSRGYYQFAGKQGVFTRKQGLDRETNKQLLLKHIRESGSDGAPLKDLNQVLIFLSDGQVRFLLQGLKSEGKITMRGYARGARWHIAELENSK